MLKRFLIQRSYRTENQAVSHSHTHSLIHSLTHTCEEHYICIYGDYPTSYTDIPQVVSLLPVFSQQVYCHFPLLLCELHNRIAMRPVETIVISLRQDTRAFMRFRAQCQMSVTSAGLPSGCTILKIVPKNPNVFSLHVSHITI